MIVVVPYISYLFIWYGNIDEKKEKYMRHSIKIQFCIGCIFRKERNEKWEKNNKKLDCNVEIHKWTFIENWRGWVQLSLINLHILIGQLFQSAHHRPFVYTELINFMMDYLIHSP